VEIQLTANPWAPARIAYTWAMNYSKSLQPFKVLQEISEERNLVPEPLSIVSAVIASLA